MEDLKRYRRLVSRRLGRAEREGRLGAELKRMNDEADRIWRDALAEIRREDAAARRRTRASATRRVAGAKRPAATSRAPKRKRA